ncbi:MAG: hypothetical protein MI919_15570, partial [Holophagales bacterium]|nr:hypothetical protein [Holophagales bacterium]
MSTNSHLRPPDNPTASDACTAAREAISAGLAHSEGAGEGRLESLRCHLESCSACRSELIETLQAWSLFDSHIPTLDLSFYALGLPTGLATERLEAHLELCAACREELALLRTSIEEEGSEGETEGLLRFPVRRQPAAPEVPDWRRLAAAAGIAAVVTATGFAWVASPDRPEESLQTTIVADSSPMGSTWCERVRRSASGPLAFSSCVEHPPPLASRRRRLDSPKRKIG